MIWVDPASSQGSLKVEEGGSGVSQSQRRCDGQSGSWNDAIDGFEDGKGYKPRKASSVWELGEARKPRPLEPSENNTAPKHLEFSPVRCIVEFDPPKNNNNKMINLCCLRLWDNLL